jgi:hypothetical protein
VAAIAFENPYSFIPIKRRPPVKIIAVLTSLVLLSGAAMAQPPTSPNCVYGELAGNGLFYSINYDHLFTGSIGGRVGACYVSPSFVSTATFPLMAYYLIGSGNSKLELGLGACVILQQEGQSFSWGSGDDNFEGNGFLGTTTVGYRYQRAEGGIVFRVGLTPFFGKYVRETLLPSYRTVREDVFKFNFSGGISVGYAF